MEMPLRRPDSEPDKEMTKRPNSGSLLSGLWYRQGDGVNVGEIQDRCMIWHVDQIEIKEKVSKLSTVDNQVELIADGVVYLGEVFWDAQQTIRWNDGDVWLRK